MAVRDGVWSLKHDPGRLLRIFFRAPAFVPVTGLLFLGGRWGGYVRGLISGVSRGMRGRMYCGVVFVRTSVGGTVFAIADEFEVIPVGLLAVVSREVSNCH